MDPSEAPRYTATQLELLAADLLADEFRERLEIPVDVEFLLETREGVELDILPGLEERFGVHGAVLRRDEGRFLVVLDQRLADHPNSHRYRFTVAEELGHVCLHSGVLDAIRTVDDALRLMRHDAYHEMDRNARRFAAAVLMPPGPLCDKADRLYPALIDEAGFHSEKVLGAMAKSLARDFRVSETAMRFRMMNWPAQLVDKVDRAVRAEERTLRV